MITLVLGGARSGKSVVAESVAHSIDGPVTYVATLHLSGDADLERRVEAHKERRDPSWSTVEAGSDLPSTLALVRGTVLVDSLGPWVARHVMGADDPDALIAALVAALVSRQGDSVVVSDEVGLSVHPGSSEGREFRDVLGAANRAVSEAADRAYLVVAGRALALPPPGSPA